MLKVILLAVVAYFTVAAQAACTVTDDKGTTWNLSKFADKDFSIAGSGAADAYAVVYRTCGKTSVADCSGNTCFVEQSSGTTLFTLSKWEASGMTVTAIEDGVKIQYKNGDPFPVEPTSFSIEFKCGSNPTPTYTADFNNFIFAAFVEDKSICSGGGGDGLSGGWIFIILLLSATVLWLIIGIAVMHKVYGAPLAISSAPGWPLVTKIPTYTADGIKFTFAKLRGLCGRSAGDYADPE